MTAATTVDLDFERALLDGVGRILLTPSDIARARDALLALATRTADAAPVAFKHKVTTVMATNARDLADDSDPRVAAAASNLARALQRDDEAAIAHRELLQTEVIRISQILGDRGCIIKGFCNARFYPSEYNRWMRDIDVFCPSWVDALELLDLLLRDGYEFDLDECSWVKADKSRGREMYGQIFLIRPQGDDFCRIDIHYGTYSVGYAGYLGLPTDGLMADHALGGTTVKVLEPRLIPLIAQSHALSDGYVAIKDINDFVALALAAPLDWKRIGEELAAHRLQPQASLLAKHVLSLYDHEDVVTAAKALIAGTGSPRFTLWQTHNRSWKLRAAVNTSFAARWRLRQGDGVRSAMIDAVRCYLFYVRRLDLAVRTRSPIERTFRALMAEPNLDDWELRPDACTLLIDADVVARVGGMARKTTRPEPVWSATPEPGIEVAHSDESTLVHMGGRTFVPTLDLIIPPSDAEVAAGV